jgi:hypothetical protein
LAAQTPSPVSVAPHTSIVERRFEGIRTPRFSI